MSSLEEWLGAVRDLLEGDEASPADDALSLLDTVLEVYGASMATPVAARVYEASVSKALLLVELDRDPAGSTKLSAIERVNCA